MAGGAVLVDGRTRPKSHRLEGGEEIEVELPGATASSTPVELDLPVVCEDEHLLVVDKPAGLVVHPRAGRARHARRTASSRSAPRRGDPERPGLVHRLDRDTSGLLLVARSEDAHEALRRPIRERRVERRYLALVHGAPRSRTGRIDAPIGRDRVDRAPLARHRDAAGRGHVVRADGGAGERTLLERAARDGADAPDPRPPRGDRPAGRRATRLRGGGDLGLERQFLHAAPARVRRTR